LTGSSRSVIAKKNFKEGEIILKTNCEKGAIDLPKVAQRCSANKALETNSEIKSEFLKSLSDPKTYL